MDPSQVILVMDITRVARSVRAAVYYFGERQHITLLPSEELVISGPGFDTIRFRAVVQKGGILVLVRHADGRYFETLAMEGDTIRVYPLSL